MNSETVNGGGDASPYAIFKDGAVIPCDALEWAEWFEADCKAAAGDPAASARCVARDNVGPWTVSTVFLGLNHNFSSTGPGVWFESMAFGPPPLDCECDRYSTLAEAQAGHAAMCALCARTEPETEEEESE